MSRRGVAAGGEAAASGPQTPPNLDERIAEVEWPKFKPPYSDLVVDDEGNAWVEHYRSEHPDLEIRHSDPTRWSVFGRSGEWLGEVHLPGRFFLRSIGRNLMLGVWQDETGARSIRGYVLIKP